MQRVLDRRKPTKPLAVDEDGREVPDQTEGFRDQLVWEHVRGAAEMGPVIFISDNTRDFGVKRTRKHRSRTEKPRKRGAFQRAADGIRTHDLLHGKQTL